MNSINIWVQTLCFSESGIQESNWPTKRKGMLFMYWQGGSIMNPSCTLICKISLTWYQFTKYTISFINFLFHSLLLSLIYETSWFFRVVEFLCIWIFLCSSIRELGLYTRTYVKQFTDISQTGWIVREMSSRIHIETNFA